MTQEMLSNSEKSHPHVNYFGHHVRNVLRTRELNELEDQHARLVTMNQYLWALGNPFGMRR